MARRVTGSAADIAGDRTKHSLSLTTGGITLLGVLLSVGITVAFGIEAAPWARVLAGAGTTLLLVLVVKVGTAAGRGPLARLASWVISAPREDA